ncbi:MAG: ROK family protein [Nakamurella sp.]
MTDPATSPLLIGVDIGGSKIAAGLVSAATSTVLHRMTAPTPRGAEAILAATERLIAELAGGQPIAAVGVGVAGVVRDGVVVSAGSTMTDWARTDVAGRLSAMIGRPVVVQNDVRAAAVGELVSGPTVDRMVFVSIGTGVGGALVLDGRLQTGAVGAAGELGHLLVDRHGALACGCGRLDHLEAVLAGPAIAAAYRAATNEALPTIEIVRRASSGDTVALQVISNSAATAGRAPAGLAVALDVEAVVLGGGVAAAGELLTSPLRLALQDSTPAWLGPYQVRTAATLDDGPVLGAALMTQRDADGAR